MNHQNNADQNVCAFLRAKNPFGSLEGGGNPWMHLDTANTICWCVKSQGPIGPDARYVEPARCTEGRTCYEAPNFV